MANGLGGGGLAALLLAKVVCCGGLLLLATGGLSGIGAWLLDVGPATIVAAGIAVLAGLAIRRYRRTKVAGAGNERLLPRISSSSP